MIHPRTLLVCTVLTILSTPPSISSPQPVNCLIVGGGPDREDNEAGIESNVRYLGSILPTGGLLRVLFADGSHHSHTVQYLDDNEAIHYRAPRLPRIDGPSSTPAFKHYLAQEDHGDRPLFLYFTGHGAPDRDDTFSNNEYAMWGDDGVTVDDMRGYVAHIDERTPVTLLMVQCFSGGFASVFFQGSTSGHPHVRPNSCGYFASLAQREAAGCTSEVNEADYHDFTTYFIGALCGHDRVGRPVTTADFDGDGIVEMDEAFAYALINDKSIDTPTSTSDAYVRKFGGDVDDDVIFATPYSTILSYADPARKAVLDAISTQLGLSGEGRLKYAFSVFNKRAAVREDDESEEDEEGTVRWIRFVRTCKTVYMEHKIETTGSADVRSGLEALLKTEHTNPFVRKDTISPSAVR